MTSETGDYYSLNLFFDKNQLPDLKPEDLELFYKRLTVKIFMALGFPVMVVFFIVHLFRGNYIESTILFFTLATVLVTFLSMQKNNGVFTETTRLTFSYRCIGFMLAILFLYSVYVKQDFSVLHWCYLFSIFVAFALGAEEGFIWVVLFFCAISFVVYASDFTFIPPEIAVNYKIRFLLSLLMLSIVLLIISHVRDRNLKELFERQQALKHSEERYKKAFEQNKELLKEVHHRVKNNLQVISSLLYLQTGKINNLAARNLVKETRDRIRSMAMVYETLYQSKDFTQIDMEYYVKNLFSYLLSEYHKDDVKILMSIDARKIFLGLDSAIPICLILQELMSNALKHAFNGKKEGEIRFSLIKFGSEKYRMIFSDNGIGLPNGIEFQKPQTLGFQLISSLVSQISGSFKYVKNNGTSFSMDFIIKNP